MNGNLHMRTNVKDPAGIALLDRCSDTAARFLLIDKAALLLDDRKAMCLLIHAEVYLKDRIGYEMEPWPVGMVKSTWFPEGTLS